MANFTQQFTWFKFMSHTTLVGGYLPNDKRAHACWYYCRCAITAMKAVDDGAQYEGEDDHINSLNNIARGVAKIYQLESPDEFLKFMDYVKLEAMRCELEWDIRIEKPAAAPHIKGMLNAYSEPSKLKH